MNVFTYMQNLDWKKIWDDFERRTVYGENHQMEGGGKEKVMGSYTIDVWNMIEITL
jgi:hypothetical protein